MSDEGINLHKRMAMGAGEGIAKAPGKGPIQKYKEGGKVMPEKGVANLPARGSAPPPLPVGGKTKIATMKKGGMPKKPPGLMIAIGMPIKKSSGRGRQFMRVSDLIGRLKAAQLRLAGVLTSGTPQTFYAYQRLVGVHQGLDEALNIINQLIEEEENVE